MVCKWFCIVLMRIVDKVAVPRIVRVDKGTENVSIATEHISLRLQHSDEFSGKSFIYGPL